MRRNKKGKIKNPKFAIAVILLVVAMVFNAVTVFADETNDTASAEKGSISMSYPVSGAEFSLYKVGTSDQNGGYVLSENFAAYQVDLSDSNAADTLADYVKRDGLTADATTVSGTDGEVAFLELDPAVYLLVGEVKTVDDVKYTPEAVMLELPQWDNDQLVYNVEISGKFSKENVGTTEITAVKVWKNDSESSRPKKVTVQLLQNGNVYEEADLTKDNNWEKTWDELDGNYTWTVAEKSVPDGYTVAKSTSGTRVVITNTSISGKKSSDASLPYTGQIWWPAAVCAIAGLLLILIGIICVRRKQ